MLHGEGKAKQLIPRLTVYLQDVTTKNLVRYFDLSRSKAMQRPFEKSFEINDTENIIFEKFEDSCFRPPPFAHGFVELYAY